MTDATLADLRFALLSGLRAPKPLRPRDTALAFERHQLLAIRFQAAARLDRGGGTSGRDRWTAYLREHLPHAAEHADVLWSAWRRPLLRHEQRGPSLIAAHGRRDAHLRREPGESGPLVVDLESMWDDFERSVDSLIEACGTDPRRARRVLARLPLPAQSPPAAQATVRSVQPAATPTSPHPVVYTVQPLVDPTREV